jgi:hypothetical protein
MSEQVNSNSSFLPIHHAPEKGTWTIAISRSAALFAAYGKAPISEFAANILLLILVSTEFSPC